MPAKYLTTPSAAAPHETARQADVQTANVGTLPVGVGSFRSTLVEYSPTPLVSPVVQFLWRPVRRTGYTALMQASAQRHPRVHV